MAELRRGRAFQFRDDALSQHFPQFHSPLVKAVDVPDDALGENRVLVEGDELAEDFRREPLGEESVGRAIALKDPVRNEPIGGAFGLHLFGGLAEGQRFGLGKDVRQQDVVVPSKRVERLDEGDEVTRDEPGPLMNQLVEGMLAVGPRLAPVDGPGIRFDPRPRLGQRRRRSTVRRRP